MSMKAKLKDRRKASQNLKSKSEGSWSKLGSSVEPEKPKKEYVIDTTKLKEDILPDDYPIYGNYFYIADGKLYRSDWHDITVRQLKAYEGFNEVCRCDIYGRQAQMEAQDNA